MSIKTAVESVHGEMQKKGVKHIEVSASADKKHYIAKHVMHNYESDPKMHVLKTKGALAAHMAMHLKGPGCDDDGASGDTD